MQHYNTWVTFLYIVLLEHYFYVCNTVCVLIAGNPGRYLTDNGSVYITRDGGLTWEQVNSYPTIKHKMLFGKSIILAEKLSSENSGN